MAIDPIRRELIRNALVTIADNMVVRVIRTARSTLVKNNMDFSSSVCDADGEMVAQGLALPSHLGATMPALKGCLDYFGDDLQPGDILANNDPYSGGSHLPDVFMFLPVFADDEVVCILSLILHHTDMGGRVAGGNAADSNEIFEEGLRIAPCKIQVGGDANPTVSALHRTQRSPAGNGLGRHPRPDGGPQRGGARDGEAGRRVRRPGVPARLEGHRRLHRTPGAGEHRRPSRRHGRVYRME